MKLVLKEKIDQEYEVVSGKNHIKIFSPNEAEVFLYRPHTPPLIIRIEGYKNKIIFENSDNNKYFEIPWSKKSFLEEPEDTVFMITGALNKHKEIFEGYTKKIDEKLSFDELRDLEKLVYPYLKNIWVHEVHFENMKHLEGDDVNLLLYADVDGDWKHDHLAYKDAVKEFCDDNGFEIVSHRQRELGHSDSDSYEAEHIFWIHKKKLKEKLYKENVRYYNGETKISNQEKRELNKICSKYCGWKLQQEIRPLWKELSDFGIDDITIEGYPDQIADDGGKSWSVSFTINGALVTNSRFIYQVYEGSKSLKNDYNIYFS